MPMAPAPPWLNPRMRVLAEATMPTLPMSMSIMTTRRRSGWPTTCSDSEVVNPAPVRAERAWKRAVVRDMPVATRMSVATRVTTSDSATSTSSEPIAITGQFCPLAPPWSAGAPGPSPGGAETGVRWGGYGRPGVWFGRSRARVIPGRSPR